MKKATALLLAAILCLCLAACGKAPEQSAPSHTEAAAAEGSGEPRQESSNSPNRENAAGNVEQPTQQDIELIGPWHLDGEKNDLAAFADSLGLFPGYGAWGAGMEIRSNGQLSWHIGAESWHGTYTVEESILRAQLASDSEQSPRLWDLRILEENGVAELEMDYQDITIYWVYGDREDISVMGLPARVYVDRQGTDAVYSRLSIAPSDTGYVIEMEIYRLGYFRGTAVEAGGVLVYTDDLVDIKGTIQYDDTHAVFEVTQSPSDTAEAGTTWVFPELQEG